MSAATVDVITRALALPPLADRALHAYAHAYGVPATQVQLAALVRTLDLSFEGRVPEVAFEDTLRRVLAEGPGRHVRVSGEEIVVRLGRETRARLDDAFVDDVLRTMRDELEAAVFEDRGHEIRGDHAHARHT